jgi:hypothetical protein
MTSVLRSVPHGYCDPPVLVATTFVVWRCGLRSMEEISP